MNLLKYFVVSTILLLSTAALADFIVVGHRNVDSTATGTLTIFGESGVTGTISSNDGGMNQTFTIPSSGTLEISIPQARFFQAAESNTIVNRALFVSSDSPISGALKNQKTNSTDMSYLLDISSLGTSYRLAGYQPISTPNQLSVTATEDNTTITVDSPYGMFFNNFNSIATPFSKTLNAGESFFFETRDDLTGTLVTADKPIAVFSGVQGIQIPYNAIALDHIFTQVPPTDVYADKFRGCSRLGFKFS